MAVLLRKSSGSLDWPIWPIGVTDDDKLSLMHDKWWPIIHKNCIRMAIYLWKGSSKQIVKHNVIIANGLTRGEQPVFFVDVVSEITTPMSCEHKTKELLKIQRKISRFHTSRVRRFICVSRHLVVLKFLNTNHWRAESRKEQVCTNRIYCSQHQQST